MVAARGEDLFNGGSKSGGQIASFRLLGLMDFHGRISGGSYIMHFKLKGCFLIRSKSEKS